MKSIIEKIRNGDYQSELPYPDFDHKPKGDRQRMKEAYRDDSNRLERQFKIDALEAAGLTNHAKADAIYNKAWEDGHSSGFESVWYELEELADLVGDLQ